MRVNAIPTIGDVSDREKRRLAEANALVFQAALARGEGIEIPSGAYHVLPLKIEKPYSEIRGAGLQQTQLALPPGVNAPILDLDGREFYHTAIRDLSFWAHRNKAPFMFRLNHGRKHYSVELNNVMFRGNDGAGLYCEEQRFLELNRVFVIGCSGTGVHMKNCVSVVARLDIEQCGRGIFIEGTNRRRDVATTLVNPYTETIDGFGIHVHNVTGVRIDHPAASILFTGDRCKLNRVYAGEPIKVEFNDGASRNFVFCDVAPRRDELENYLGPGDQ